MKLKDTCSLKAFPNLDSILKNRNITLLTKVHIVKAMVSPVVTHGCENWTTKKAECQRTDAFELWCWRRILIPLDSKEIKPVNPKGNQPSIFIGRTDAEAPILWPPDAKSWLIGKAPDAGKDWGQEKGVTEDEGGEQRVTENDRGWMASPTQWTWVWANSRRYWRTGKPGVLQSMGLQRVGHDLATELNWTELRALSSCSKQAGVTP